MKQWTRHHMEQLINACGKLFSSLSVQKKTFRGNLYFRSLRRVRAEGKITNDINALLEEIRKIIIVYGSSDRPTNGRGLGRGAARAREGPHADAKRPTDAVVNFIWQWSKVSLMRSRHCIS